jgi:hypothetical protein
VMAARTTVAGMLMFRPFSPSGAVKGAIAIWAGGSRGRW